MSVASTLEQKEHLRSLERTEVKPGLVSAGRGSGEEGERKRRR